jgi:diguanylate cyclase (GGDEF)-like protein
VSVSALALILLIGTADYYTGHRLGFSLFYTAPILFVAWFLGRPAGIAFAGVGALTWLTAEMLSRTDPAPTAILAWNAGIRLGFFLLLVFLLCALRRTLERETALARTDALTGAVTPFMFYELAEREILRARRNLTPLSIAYLDADHFKTVNDSRGHAEGDRLLRTAVLSMRRGIRETDIVARLGGDEFAVLLPDADGTTASDIVLRIRAQLMIAMHDHGWPVTFSVGVATFLTPPASVGAMLKQTDALMYRAKGDGRNAVRHEVGLGPAPVSLARRLTQDEEPLR